MTEHPNQPNDPRIRYERGRDDFGRALIEAARDREHQTVAPRRRRRRSIAVVGGLALAGGLAALAVGIPSPSRDLPGAPKTIGVSPAVAAVTALRDSLHSGVLVRDAIDESPFLGRNRTQDWTDLATRDQHMKILGKITDLEYWNPSEHERWTIESPMFRAKDGRRVVSHTTDNGSSNGSASESPREEIDRLLKLARSGDVTLRPGGRDGERVLERRQECYSARNDGVMECPDPAKPSLWPRGARHGMRPVLAYERWWITAGDEPRMLRYDNGNLDQRGHNRTPIFTTVYREWRVLPATAANLALVRPPQFPSDRYLILTGGSGVVGDAVRAGKITCTSGPTPETTCGP